MKIMGFDYGFKYKKGISNAAADALSRLPVAEFHAISTFQTELLTKIRNSWSNDSALTGLIQNVMASNGNYKKYS